MYQKTDFALESQREASCCKHFGQLGSVKRTRMRQSLPPGLRIHIRCRQQTVATLRWPAWLNAVSYRTSMNTLNNITIYIYKKRKSNIYHHYMFSVPKVSQQQVHNFPAIIQRQGWTFTPIWMPGVGNFVVALVKSQTCLSAGGVTLSDAECILCPTK